MRFAALVAGIAGIIAAAVAAPAQDKKAPKYIGAEKCKKCHDAKSKGEMYQNWCGTKHAKAFDALATEKAKEYAKAKGIADPQKDESCLKCHTTGGQPNVTCEACHGPGEKHFKERMAAEDDSSPIGDDEIVRKPDAKTCLKCHNEESPSFVPFCFACRYQKIQHLIPNKKHDDLPKCACPEGKCACKNGACK